MHPIVEVTSILAGIVLWTLGLMRRRADAPPLVSLDPRAWKPAWKTRPYFEGKGFALYLAGTTLVVLGGLAATIRHWGG